MSFSDIAISIRGLSKAYTISQGALKRPSFREAVIDKVKNPFRKLPTETFQALNNVSFDVKKGDALGIIGRNGAGKSTLLKVLSRIVEPTRGAVDIYGRVGSLLEVGTGFHPELTGRENVYLNGAILGMRRAEIRNHFDDIVDFAEVSKFLDTPVKRYSSGMYIRLAFAVAAHLNPEILIVDEVLAVGDAQFQKKCIGKMGEAVGGGRTVLFVSHNMTAIAKLCKSAVLLENGTATFKGGVAEAVAHYLDRAARHSASLDWESQDAPGDSICIAKKVCLLDKTGRVSAKIDIRDPFTLELEYEVLRPGKPLVPVFRLASMEGHIICFLHDQDPVWRGQGRPKGLYRSAVTVPGNLLSEGDITIGIAIGDHINNTVHVSVDEALNVEILDPSNGDGARADYIGYMPGIVRPKLPWTTKVLA